MEDGVKRVLFVNSEIFPFRPESDISHIGRYLPQGIQERKKDIRSFMPRYGCINERKHQLHEVIRLSGMNIIIGDIDRPLVIKVASISSARIQVYFIDNEDYFKRKQTVRDDKGVFFKDNGERAIFFARGVLETVKKLRWAPDVIHCQGWITHLLPLYLKKVFREDPIFSASKVVLSLSGDIPAERYAENLIDLVPCGGITPGDIAVLEEPTGINVAKLAIQYSDGVVIGAPDIPKELLDETRRRGLPMLPYFADSMKDGRFVDEYDAFYDKI